jgi:hypothetical protein
MSPITQQQLSAVRAVPSNPCGVCLEEHSSACREAHRIRPERIENGAELVFLTSAERAVYVLDESAPGCFDLVLDGKPKLCGLPRAVLESFENDAYGPWFYLRGPAVALAPPPPTGGKCRRCSEFNPYQSGPYVCFQCRQDPWR